MCHNCNFHMYMCIQCNLKVYLFIYLFISINCKAMWQEGKCSFIWYSLCKHHQQHGWTTLKLGVPNPIWYSHIGCRSLSTWANFCCLKACTSWSSITSRVSGPQNNSVNWDMGMKHGNLTHCTTNSVFINKTELSYYNLQIINISQQTLRLL